MTTPMTLDRFKDIEPGMGWRDAALAQIEAFQQFAEGLGLPWAVVGQHTSKSIALPVISVTFGDKEVFIRDNFYDLNVCVVSATPLTIPLSELFEGVLQPLSWDWYLAVVDKCRGYSWRGWSDEQMDMPGLLAPSADAPNHMVKRIDTKSRWEKRLTDPEWFGRDWSAHKVTWDGTFGPDATLWVQGRPFMQGIEPLVPAGAHEPYQPGCCHFALALDNLGQVKTLITRLTARPEHSPEVRTHPSKGHQTMKHKIQGVALAAADYCYLGAATLGLVAMGVLTRPTSDTTLAGGFLGLTLGLVVTSPVSLPLVVVGATLDSVFCTRTLREARVAKARARAKERK